MHTLLISSDFAESAKALDGFHLAQQSRANLWMLKVLAYTPDAPFTSEMVKFWKGHEDWLFIYNESIIKELLLRGYNCDIVEEFDSVYDENFVGLESDRPKFISDENLHSICKKQLYRYNPNRYWIFEEYDEIEIVFDGVTYV